MKHRDNRYELESMRERGRAQRGRVQRGIEDGREGEREREGRVRGGRGMEGEGGMVMASPWISIYNRRDGLRYKIY